jgi:hypothetical protein
MRTKKSVKDKVGSHPPFVEKLVEFLEICAISMSASVVAHDAAVLQVARLDDPAEIAFAGFVQWPFEDKPNVKVLAAEYRARSDGSVIR